MWEEIDKAPFGQDLELAVIDNDGAHALVFACRRTNDGWINSETRKRIVVHPTHWRRWPDGEAEGM